MKQLDVVVKEFSREYLKENGTMIFQDRELIVEKDQTSPENVMYRFKLGNGILPYSELPYISNLYALFPNFKLFNKQYTQCINIKFSNEE